MSSFVKASLLLSALCFSAPVAHAAIDCEGADKGRCYQIESAYKSLLGRSASEDQAGKEYWVGRLQNGMKLEDIRNTIAASPEGKAYAKIHPEAKIVVRKLDCYNKDVAVCQTVEAAYRTVLGRDSDQAGLEYWASRMYNGMNDEDMRAALADSAEGRALKKSKAKKKAGKVGGSAAKSAI